MFGEFRVMNYRFHITLKEHVVFTKNMYVFFLYFIFLFLGWGIVIQGIINPMLNAMKNGQTEVQRCT